MQDDEETQDTNEDGESEMGSDVEDVSAGVLAPGLGKKSRSITVIPSKFQPITAEAKKLIENYTYYQKPLLTPGELVQLVERSWDRANRNNSSGRYLLINSDLRSYVCINNSAFECWITDLM